MKHFLLKMITLFWMFLSTMAQSAEISFRTDTSTGCTIHLKGLITEGDSENLKKIYIENITSNSSITQFGVGARICLDSPGGSLVEAFKIFDFLTSGTANAFTYVPKGASCESACAIAFLAGGAGYYGSSPARAIHPKAKLGFHSPDLVIPDGNYNKAQVSKAYSIALETISRLIKLRRTALADRTMLPSSVLETMLRTPPDEMFYVETVGQAAQWGISIFPVKAPENFSELNWLAGCLNSFGMINDEPPYYDPMDKDWEAVKSNSEYEGALPTVPKNGPPFEFSMGEGSKCEIHISNLDQTALLFSEISVRGEVKGVSIHYPEYIFYGANTKIVDLPITNEVLSEDRKNRFSYLRLDNAKTIRAKACGIIDDEAKITNVQNFTNLRKQAGLGGRVIAQIPLGTTVTVFNPGRYLRYDRCAAACEGSNQNAIKKCIDNNDVWIEVEYNGQRGFLSRKFLE